MRHPFINDLSDKSLDDLTKTLTDLQSKLNFAYRTQNHSLIKQLYMVIESYQAEHKVRMDELYKKHNLDNKINVTKENT
jgi:hypothetical protein